MTDMDRPALDELAESCGIEPEYEDVWGQVRRIEPGIQRALLRAMGFGVDREEEVLREKDRLLRERFAAILPSMLAVSKDRLPAFLKFRLPPDKAPGRDMRAGVTLSGCVNGQVHMAFTEDQMVFLESLEENGYSVAVYGVPFPGDLELGDYQVCLRIEEGGILQETFMVLVVCPPRAHLPASLESGSKAAGLDVSLYSLRSGRNWGVGDFTDLKNVVDWCRDRLGARMIRINPLQAIHNRRPYNVSPYLPLSPIYYNYLYLDMEAVPEFESCPEARDLLHQPEIQELLADLRNSEFVQYEKAAALKRRFLHLLFREFQSLPEEHPRCAAFRQYVEREGDALRDFALYLALSEHFEQASPPLWVWQDWPERFRHPDSEGAQAFLIENPNRVEFHQYVQWELSRQLENVEVHAFERGLSLGILHDLPLAMDRCGCESWAYPCFYVSGVRVGAPPDDFSPEGQDWGFMPFNREVLEQDAYRHLRRQFQKNCRPAGGLRIDHVMRFFRLYWIPEGKTPSEGAYVKERYEDYLNLLALESQRSRTLIVGEDLGTVPGEIRETLRRKGVLSYRLLMFEKDPKGMFLSEDAYPEAAVVSFSTHDLPTMAGFFNGADIELRHRLNRLGNDGAYHRALEERVRDTQSLLKLLNSRGFLEEAYAVETDSLSGLSDTIREAVWAFLAHTSCKLFLIALEDLLKDEHQQNIPGTTHENMNWSHKMPVSLEDLHGPEWEEPVARLRAVLERSGRCGNGAIPSASTG